VLFPSSDRESKRERAAPTAKATPADHGVPSGSGRHDLRISISVGLACLLIYNLNLRSISAGDTYPARYLPFAIWRYSSVVLDPIASTAAQGRSDSAYWIVRGRAGHQISLYPVVLPVLIAPLYLPAVLYLDARGWDEPRLDRTARVMEKVTASLLAAATAALFYLVLRRRARPHMALLLTLAFALGTTTWVISSQALWQHSLAELLVVAAMLLVTGPATPARVLAAGLICGLIAGNRPPDSILAAALGLYGMWWAGRRAPVLAAAAVLPLGLVVFYNLNIAGNLLGGYGIPPHATFLQHDVISGLLGLLFSPTRGLFVFSPFLLFLFYRPFQVPRETSYRGLTLAMAIATALQLLLYAKADWRAGFAWGPRWLTDLLPFLVWMLPPVVAGLGNCGRLLLVGACASAIAIEAIGAFWYTGVSDPAVLAAAPANGALVGGWNLKNAPYIAELRHRPAPAELTIDVRGSFDRIASGGREVRKIFAGEEIVAEGWALAGRRPPQAMVFLLDGVAAGDTSAIIARPDVERALGVTSPSGWRFSIRTDGLAPGKHVLAALVRPNEVGDLHFLGERPFRVRGELSQGAGPADSPPTTSPGRDGDLERSARDAAAVLQANQREGGFWLTAYTDTAQFENPRLEMNTFLTAVMVDLLDPVAAVAGLGVTVERARRHLASQIEATGLVRYHGRPDGPTIGTLGCVITPDADDTALVWRIAPGRNRALLEVALKTLDRYRREDGLYRTWLAPQDRYQCIDRGKDPNPADAGIQMHVLMFLAKADPPSARALCGALQRSLAQEGIWVYYREAPLIPILREAELQADGCTLNVPSTRARPSRPEQEVWIAGGRLLNRLVRLGPQPPDSAPTLRWLGTVAREDFFALRRSPPLLYHNDLTASTPRFYWSDAFGYALWLRIYYENARRS
jgi:hypothetical protein